MSLNISPPAAQIAKIGFFKRLQNRTEFGYILKLLALINRLKALHSTRRRRRRRRRCWPRFASVELEVQH
jgi:hypothetical protein